MYGPSALAEVQFAPAYLHSAIFNKVRFVFESLKTMFTVVCDIWVSVIIKMAYINRVHYLAFPHKHTFSCRAGTG